MNTLAARDVSAQAAILATVGGDSLTSAWHRGRVRGLLCAERGIRGPVLTARMVFGAQVTDSPERALQYASLAPLGAARDVMFGCGVLTGWFDGTADRPDAHECALCGMRVLDEDDDSSVCLDHGVFCSVECRVALGCSGDHE